MQRFLFFLSFVFLILFVSPTLAQHELSVSGARAEAMGGIQSPLSDVWGAFGNQAALGHLKSLTVAGFFENRYGIKELAVQGVTVALPTKFGTFAVAGSYFGYSLYNETLVGFAYGRQLVPKYLSLGLKMNYYMLSLGEDYGQKSTATVEFGLLAHPIEGLSIGLHINNPMPQELTEYDNEKLPSSIKLGAAYKFAKYVMIAVEADKNLNEEKTNLKAGLEFEFMKRIFLRAGISTFPTQHSFGAGFRWAGFRADVAFSRHEVLGYSPKVSLQYSL